MVIGPMKLKLGRYFILLGTWPHTCFGPVGPHLQGGGGLGVVLEVLAALVVHFWDNFIKQKLKSTPDLVWVGQVRSGPGPHPGVCQPVHAQGEGLQPWSLSQLG